MFTSSHSPFLPQALGHESTFMFLFVVRLSQGCVGEFKPYGYSVGVWGAGCRFFSPLADTPVFLWAILPVQAGFIIVICVVESVEGKGGKILWEGWMTTSDPSFLGPPPLPCQPHLEAHRPLVVAGLAPARSVTRQLCVSAALSRNIVGQVLSKPLAAWWASLPGQHS